MEPTGGEQGRKEEGRERRGEQGGREKGKEGEGRGGADDGTLGTNDGECIGHAFRDPPKRVHSNPNSVSQPGQHLHI